MAECGCTATGMVEAFFLSLLALFLFCLPPLLGGTFTRMADRKNLEQSGTEWHIVVGVEIGQSSHLYFFIGP